MLLAEETADMRATVEAGLKHLEKLSQLQKLNLKATAN